MDVEVYDRGEDKGKCEFCYDRFRDCYYLYIRTAGPIDYTWYWICNRCVEDRDSSYRYNG